MAEMGLFEVIYSARALRRLKPDPVPDEIIAKVIDAGIRAPSGANNQNWIFVVIKDRDKRARIGELYRRAGQVFMEMYRDAPRPPHMSEKAYARMTVSAAYLFEHVHEVPVLLLACLNPPKMVAATGKLPPEMANAGKVAPRLAGSSIYPAVQNIILACRAFGLGTVLTTASPTSKIRSRRCSACPRRSRPTRCSLLATRRRAMASPRSVACRSTR